ncbi:MAG: dickkopf-related protein, partial [Candidatus Micrarchaeota archaeon]
SWKCGGGAVVPPFDYCKSVGGGEDIGETSDCSMPTGIVGAVKRCCCQKPLAPTTIDFGRVTRKSCGTPEKVSKHVSGLTPGKYEAQVLCNSVNTIACKAIAETAGANALEFAGYSSDAVTFEVNPLATPTPTPSVTISPSSTPSVVPSVTPSASPIPSCGNGVCEASLGETVSNCPTDCSASGGNGGGGRPCTSNSDCGPGSVCVNGVCNGCLCMLDGYCNPCCLAGTDKDCGQTKKSQQTLAGTGTKTLPDDDSEWPPATQPTYAPQYALKLKCVLTEQKKVAATLTADGSPACDANMRITIGKRTLAPDASKCVQSGVHEFDVSGLEAGEYSAKATSLGGSTATCKFVIAAGFAFEPWMWIILALVVIAIAGGAYYWKKQQDKKKSGGSGGKGKRGAVKAEEETTDLLEEE